MARRTKDVTTRGAALLLALGLLILFSILGTTYVKYMTLERKDAQLDVEALHARQLAERGIWAAVGKIGAARTAGNHPATDGYVLDLPLYEGVDEGKLVPHRKYAGKVAITLEDESAKINLNYVPTRVLQAALGVDGNTARRIKGALPRQGEAANAQRHWLGSAQELVSRRLVSGKVMGRIDPKSVTVHSVSPAQGPLHFINVNSASPAVLAAVLGVDAARAKAVADARAQKPFATVAELTAAAGQDVPSFNIAGPSSAAGQLPRELSFSSRSFKVCATAELSDGTGEPCAQYLTEAVVVFDDTGKPAVTHWRETSKIQ